MLDYFRSKRRFLSFWILSRICVVSGMYGDERRRYGLLWIRFQLCSTGPEMEMEMCFRGTHLRCDEGGCCPWSSVDCCRILRGSRSNDFDGPLQALQTTLYDLPGRAREHCAASLARSCERRWSPWWSV